MIFWLYVRLIVDFETSLIGTPFGIRDINHIQYRTLYYVEREREIHKNYQASLAELLASPKIPVLGPERLKRRRIMELILKGIDICMPADKRDHVTIQKYFGFRSYPEMIQFQRDYVQAMSDSQINSVMIFLSSIESNMLFSIRYKEYYFNYDHAMFR